MSPLVGPLLFAAVLALFPARIAAGKGRSFALWWFYGWMLLIVAVPHALLLRPAPVAASPLVPIPESEGPPRTRCATCGNEVRVDTPACPYCRSLVAG